MISMILCCSYSTHCVRVQEGCSTCRARITVGPLMQVTNMQQPLCCVSDSLGSLKWGHREWKSQMLPSDFPSPLGVQPHGHQWRPWSKPSKNHTVCPEETSHSREKCWLYKDWANPTANGCLETTSYKWKQCWSNIAWSTPKAWNVCCVKDSPFRMEVLLSSYLEV